MHTESVRNYKEVSTEQVIVEMLRENTGRGLTDSGGIYGRNYERHAGRDPADAPSVKARFSPRAGNDGLEMTAWVSLYHWMASNLEFAADLQERLDAFADEHPNDSWFEVTDNFARTLYTLGELEDEPETFLTYNNRDFCDLDQGFQYTTLVMDGSLNPTHVIVQVHGGCDIRGGYTAPKVFKVRKSEWHEFEESMRVDSLYAGGNSWDLQGYNTVEPAEHNSCLERNVLTLPSYDLSEAMALPEFADEVSAIYRSDQQKADLLSTTLCTETLQRHVDAIDKNTAEMRSLLHDSFVLHLAEQHEWFVICQDGRAFLFHQDDKSFSHGHELVAEATSL